MIRSVTVVFISSLLIVVCNCFTLCVCAVTRDALRRTFVKAAV